MPSAAQTLFDFFFPAQELPDTKLPPFVWDALIWSGPWLPEYSATRNRCRRMTMLRDRYNQWPEMLFKAQSSAFCHYASRFRPGSLEPGPWLALTGCPLIVPLEYNPNWSFAVLLKADSPKRPDDPFSDDSAVMRAIDLAVSMNRRETAKAALTFLQDTPPPFGDVEAIQLSLLELAEWRTHMEWFDWKPTVFGESS